MAYRRRTYRRKNYRSGPFLRFKRKDSIGIKALKMAYNVKQLINVEFKSLTPSGTITPSTTADVRGINLMAQGTADNQRIGNSVRFKSMFMRLSLAENSSSTYPTATRHIILQDKQPNGALPSASDILQSSTSYLSPLNDDNGKRFKVLYDKTYITNTVSRPMLASKKYKKINFVTKFDGTTAAITDITTNSIVMLTLSNQATNTPTLQYDIKWRYIDN